MNWFKNNWAWFNNVPEEEQKIIKIDVMKDDVDPNEVSIENAYKTRWIWYHTILEYESNSLMNGTYRY